MNNSILRRNTWLLLTVLLFTTASDSYSQSFRWGKRGGSSSSAGGSDWETVKDMAVDRNGNLYVLSRVYLKDINVDGQIQQGYGGKDVLLSSFNCNGQLRWTKLFGNSSSDEGYNIRTDKLDGVYLSLKIGVTQYDTGHVDNDVTIINSTQTLYLVKYDTSGSFKWLRAPEPDTISTATSYTYSGGIDMDVDDMGNVTWLCQLPSGIYGGMGGFIAHDTSNYILKYDKNGNFQGGINIELSKLGNGGMVRDYARKRIYISGLGNGTPIIVGNTTITHSKFLVCFDENGKYLWKRENTTLSGGFYGRPVVDNDGNIYVSGNGVSARTIPPLTPADEFNGYVVKNGNGSATPVIIKLDKDGNTIWGRDADVNAATVARGIAMRNSGEIVFVGSYPGALIWDSAYQVPINSGNYDVFVARLNTQTGKILGVETINPSSGSEYATSIISDGRNNVYIGSEMKGSVTINGTQLSNVGGETDWFGAKFGHDNCNCTNIPEPKFSFVKNGLDVNFTYTGGSFTTAEWDFGDGNKSNQPSTTHTYAAKGIYTVCVKVTNNCGDNTYCDVVDFWPVGVSEQVLADGIKIYPNPANDVLHISGINTGGKIELYNMLGVKVYGGMASGEKENINISQLPTGNYIIQITDVDGHRMQTKVMKR